MRLDKRLYHKRLRLNVLLAVISGVALFLAFPKAGLFPLAWIALVPLFIAIRRTTPLSSLALGLITGFVFFTGLLYWISIFGYLPWALLALMQAMYIAAFAFLANLLMVRGRFALITVPALWTSIEYIRSLGMFGFTWGDLAYSQAGWLSIIQIASNTGPWGVTFLVVLVNTAVALAVLSYPKAKLQLAGTVALVLAIAAGGTVSIARIDRNTVPDKAVAMVQGGLDMTWRDAELLDKIYETYWPMTKKIGRGVDFIIWPESALPDYLPISKALQDKMARLAMDSGAHILAGGPHVTFDDNAPSGFREYNGAFLIDPSGKLAGEYYKVHLVPFGEFVPGRNWLPFLENYKVREVDYTPGKGYNILHSGKSSLGVMICFESIFPQIGREFTKNGAEALFVITNDSWFQKTAAASQHHEFSIFRAVENRRYVARNATTGITSLISPAGAVLKTAGLGEKAVVQGKFAMIDQKTVYTRFGDWFAWVCIVVGLAGLAMSVCRYNTEKHLI